MASTTSTGTAFSVWPIVGYSLLAVLLSYLAVRVVRHLKARRTTTAAAALPKPVSGAAKHKSVLGKFSFGRSTGWDWDWRRWSLPRVPSWSRVPEVVKGKARTVANAKNLTVELLPTTGLPPPPTSVPTALTTPMPTPQLVDLSTPVASQDPSTPPLTTGSTSTTFSDFPRTPSPSSHPQPQINLTTLKPTYPIPSHPSYPRPPSPHTLLATTPPPKQHKRSRSLGGVPVRRLSGGHSGSGLRNAVEMRDLSASAQNQNHVRGTSREHLLIDFSSSGSSSDEDREDRALKISPAASDIGVLPLPLEKEVLPLVGVGRHMPLVDLSDEEGSASASQTPEYEHGWKWFENAKAPVPSLSFGYGYGGYGYSASHQQLALVDSKPRSIGKQLASFPVAAAQTETLVDVDTDTDTSHTHTELVSASDPPSIHVRRLEVEQTNHSSQVREENLVDLHEQKAASSYAFKKEENAAPLVDLRVHEDEEAHVYSERVEPRVLPVSVLALALAPSLSASPIPSLSSSPIPSALASPSPPPPPLPSQPPVLVKVKVKAAFSHPLEDLIHVDTRPPVLLVSEKQLEVTDEVVEYPGLLFAEAQPTPTPIAANVVEPEQSSPLIFPTAVSHTDEMDIESQSSSQTQGGWAWDDVDVDDPWGNHVPIPMSVSVPAINADLPITAAGASSDYGSVDSPSVASPDSDVFVYTGLDASPASPELEERVGSGRGGDLIVFEAETPKSKSEGGVTGESGDDALEAFLMRLDLDSEAEVEAGNEQESVEEEEVEEEGEEVLEKSPGGTLFATVLPDDDEDGEEGEGGEGGRMPPLDLSLDERALDRELTSDQQAEEEEEEEEVTPKATPAFVLLELPILPVDGDEVGDAPEPEVEVQVPLIVVQDASSSSAETATEAEIAPASERFPDPDFLPLPESPSHETSSTSVSLLMSIDEALVSSARKDDQHQPEKEERIVLSQTPTPPASPPPIAGFRFVSSNRSQPPSPGGGGVGMRSMRLLPSPRLGVVVPLPASGPKSALAVSDAEARDKEKESDTHTPTALTPGGKPLWAVMDAAEAPLLLSSPGVRRRVLVDVRGEEEKVVETETETETLVEEKSTEDEKEAEHLTYHHLPSLKLSSSLPGSFPESAPLPVPASTSLALPPASTSTSTSTTPSPTSTSTTIAARLALAPNTLTRPPSARALVRSPLDIALAMQLRPGLGAGADPAWMVRFLMAMFGWFAVAVSGGEHFR